MPHIIVEYCETLARMDVPKLVSDLHADLATRESVSENLITSRAIPVKYVVVGTREEPDKMIHITLKLFAGRSAELRQEMAKGLQEIARKHSHHDGTSVTVEVHEMNKETYLMNKG